MTAARHRWRPSLEPDSANNPPGGGRSGDQFCDRFIVPYLTPDQRTHLIEGTRPPNSRRSLLDDLTRTYFRDRYEYRFTTVPDVETARTLEKQIRGGALTAGKPDLNPL